MGGPLPSADGRAAPTAAHCAHQGPAAGLVRGSPPLPVQEFMLLKETLKSKGL